MGSSFAILDPDPSINRAERKTRLSKCSKDVRDVASLIAENLQTNQYPRILEVGFGSGKNLFSLAKRLPNGLLVGVDDSITHFDQACRRNQKFIESGMLELHLGKVEHLPFPRHYFDGIYAGDVWSSWKDPESAIWRLGRLLKTEGRLVMFYSENMNLIKKGFWPDNQNIQQQYYRAGFSQVRIIAPQTPTGGVVLFVGSKD